MNKSKGTILVVDDDQNVRDVLGDILAGVGNYVTDTAENGDVGLDKVRRNDYDAVFTDLTMPGMNGIDFLREAKKLRPGLPIVVLTGYTTMDNAVNAMREGAGDFITKPFSVTTIMSIADRIVGERKLLAAAAANKNYESFISRLNAQLFKKLQEIGMLQSISTELDELHENADVYERVVEMAARLLLVKEASFGIVEGGELRIKASIGAQCPPVLPLRGTLFERVLQNRSHGMACFGEPNPHTGTPLTGPFLSIPFAINNEPFGILSLANKGDGAAFTDDETALALTFAKKAAQRIENNALYDVLYNNLVNTLKSLVITIEARDSYTRQHSERVTAYAVAIAEEMGLTEEEKDAIRFGGYLHDVGKIGVRDMVLLKPDRLTAEEMDEIRQHPVIGGNIIKPLRFFPKERDLIVHHHERYDGAGYPDALSGAGIPVTARILAVADSFDAMTSSRPYRAARSRESALEEIVRCAGSQFDADVVRAFRQVRRGKEQTHGV